eukprot:6885839-Prymnesium_polylepis.2
MTLRPPPTPFHRRTAVQSGAKEAKRSGSPSAAAAPPRPRWPRHGSTSRRWRRPSCTHLGIRRCGTGIQTMLIGFHSESDGQGLSPSSIPGWHELEHTSEV